jgi:hypothetical protein
MVRKKLYLGIAVLLFTCFIASCGSTWGEKQITSFVINEVSGVIDDMALTIEITLPVGTTVNALSPEIEFEGLSVSPGDGVEQDFSSPVTYTVTAIDGSSIEYIVTVTVAVSPEKEITSFEIDGIFGTIDTTGHTIALTVPFGTDRSLLTPILIITGATVSPASGAAVDFTAPVTYTVTAADGSSIEYIVTITVALSSVKEITSFLVNGFSGVIDSAAGTVDVAISYGSDLTALTPTIDIAGESVVPASGVEQDFTSQITYTVTAADGSQKAYDVRVIQGALPDTLSLTANIWGTVYEFDLYKYSVRSQDFRVRTWTTADGYTEVTPQVRTYRGYVVGDPNIRVVAGIATDGILLVKMTAGNHPVKVVDWSVGIDVSGQLVDLPVGTIDPRRVVQGATLSRPAAPQPSGLLPPSGPLQLAQVATDSNNISVNNRGGWENTLLHAELEISWIDMDFTRNIGLAIDHTEAVLRVDRFYVNDLGLGLLDEVAAHWSTDHAAEDWDFVHGDHGVGGGVSYIGNPYSIGGAFHHELGHSLSMKHSRFTNFVGGQMMADPLEQERAIARRNTKEADYVDVPTGVDHDPIHPNAVADACLVEEDQTTLIRVLDNDYDIFGGDIHIRHYTSTTVPGGTVTMTTADGLDALSYTPAAGYTGKDLIIYATENASGLYSMELVHIQVVPGDGSAAGLWTMDADPVVGDSVPDDSGNGHPAAVSGTYAEVAGVKNGAIEISDGGEMIIEGANLLSTIPADYTEPKSSFDSFPLHAAASNEFDPVDGSFSAAFWFRSSDLSGQIPLLGKRYENDTNGVGYRVYADSSGILLKIGEWHYNQNAKQVTIDTALTQDTWYHVAFVIDRSNDTASLFLNGQKSTASISLLSNSQIFASYEDLKLQSPAAGNSAFDELSLYYRVLSDAEILALYTTP